MDVIHCYLMFMIVILYPFTKTIGYDNKCDCDSVRNVLAREIFDLKFENDKLTSRLEHIESVLHVNRPGLQGNQQVAGQTASMKTDRILTLEDKVALIESKLHDRKEDSKKSLELNRLITKALSSEKVKRLQTERKIEEGLIRINETFEVFKAYVDTKFGSHVENISVQIADYTKHLSENVSRLENNVEKIYATFANLENRTQDIIEKKILKIENDIEVIGENISVMNGDINSVIDIVLLDQIAVCLPNCTNGCVCFKPNSCRCKPFTEGNVCETFVCDDECYKNGGKSDGPGKCTCPEGLSGSNCETIVCPVLPRIQNGRLFQHTGDGIRNNYESVSEYTCNKGYLLNGNKETYTRECQADGTWSGEEPFCDAIVCPVLPRIQNGRLFQHTGDGIRNNYESVSEYICNKGYLLNGNNETYTRECQADGTWSGEEPFCDVPRCELIHPFYGGQVMYFGDRKRWTVAVFGCDDEYSLFPNNVDFSECMDNFKWSPVPPACFKKALVKKPRYSNIQRQGRLLHGESYTFSCRRGYELYKKRFLNVKRITITNNNGTLFPKVPKCVVKSYMLFVNKVSQV